MVCPGTCARGPVPRLGRPCSGGPEGRDALGPSEPVRRAAPGRAPGRHVMENPQRARAQGSRFTFLTRIAPWSAAVGATSCKEMRTAPAAGRCDAAPVRARCDGLRDVFGHLALLREAGVDVRAWRGVRHVENISLLRERAVWMKAFSLRAARARWLVAATRHGRARRCGASRERRRSSPRGRSRTHRVPMHRSGRAGSGPSLSAAGARPGQTPRPAARTPRTHPAPRSSSPPPR